MNNTQNTQAVAEQALLRADRAVLESLALAGQHYNQAMATLNGEHYDATAHLTAQRLGQYATEVDTLRRVADLTGTMRRHATATERAAKGEYENVWNYFDTLEA